jgi:Caudovirus prohead serine protease
MQIERKRLPFTLKADSAGSFTAVFATLGVIDHDGDVTVEGAFKDGVDVIVGSWGHKTHELPVGKGTIRTTPAEAVVEGEFFLNTGPGKDTYETVKALGPLGEWSYVFTVTKQSFGEKDGRQVRFLEGLNVYSVDPVLAGAGIDTRTTDIKSLTAGLSFEAHSEEITELSREFVSRCKERLAARQKEGRMFSAANVERLAAIAESLSSAGADLKALIAQGEPKTNESLVRELLRFQRFHAGLTA